MWFLDVKDVGYVIVSMVVLTSPFHSALSTEL